MVAESLITHLRSAIGGATLETDPGPHLLVRDLLPQDVYTRLLDTMPPPEGFDVADDTKANFDPETSTLAPEHSRESWLWFQREIVDGVIAPLLVERFQPHITAACVALFGEELAAEAAGVRRFAFRGRLMLRRPGYRLRPHRDTKIAAVTGLIYFARPGDHSEYGTDIYRVENDQGAPSMKSFYPENVGATTTLARSVPFEANSALFFVNTLGMAHAATFPRKTKQRERYAYQFYVGPSVQDLSSLIHRMPPQQAATWGGIQQPADGY